MKVKYNKLNQKRATFADMDDNQLEKLVAMARLLAVLALRNEEEGIPPGDRADCLDTFIIEARKILRIEP